MSHRAPGGGEGLPHNAPVSPPPALPVPIPLRQRRSLLRRGLITQCFCTGIAVVLWLFGSRRLPLLTDWVYSTAIGTSSWLFIDGGRTLAMHLLRRFHADPRMAQAMWPGTALMMAVVVLGAAFGYTLGTALGDAFSGQHMPSLLDNQPALITTLLCSAAATYYFYSTERLHHERAAAESARRLALENQLRLLESQLEPHMLFNTLANLRVLIGLDPPRAQAMLDRLIAFLRATFEASRERMHPLATEFERLADYLQLIAVRMGPRLQFTLDLPAALRDHPIPPLLLQPLVENAIKHGLEPKVEGGRIAVSARREGQNLHLAVRDTGVGLATTPAATPPAPTHAAAGAPADTATNYGTAHVRARLEAMFGQRATFTLQAADDAEGGTLALIVLPCPAEPGTTPTTAAPAA